MHSLEKSSNIFPRKLRTGPYFSKDLLPYWYVQPKHSNSPFSTSSCFCYRMAYNTICVIITKLNEHFEIIYMPVSSEDWRYTTQRRSITKENLEWAHRNISVLCKSGNKRNKFRENLQEVRPRGGIRNKMANSQWVKRQSAGSRQPAEWLIN